MDAQYYSSQEAVEDYLRITIDEQFLQRFDEWNAAVARHIMRLTGRQFVADAEPSARLYDGDGSCELIVEDFIDSEELTVEQGNDEYGGSFAEVAAGGASGYILQPNNAAALGLPFRKILLRSGIFMPGTQNHRITARWGYSEAVPEDIKFAATVFLSGILTAAGAGSGSGSISSERIGNYSVSYADEKGLQDFEQAKNTLDLYKKHEL